jgi:hypothetical protein
MARLLEVGKPPPPHQEPDHLSVSYSPKKLGFFQTLPKGARLIRETGSRERQKREHAQGRGVRPAAPALGRCQAGPASAAINCRAPCSKRLFEHLQTRAAHRCRTDSCQNERGAQPKQFGFFLLSDLR